MASRRSLLCIDGSPSEDIQRHTLHSYPHCTLPTLMHQVTRTGNAKPVREFGGGFYRARLLGRIICLPALLIQHKGASHFCATDVILEKWMTRKMKW